MNNIRQFIERKKCIGYSVVLPCEKRQPNVHWKDGMWTCSYLRFVFTAIISKLSWITYSVAYVNIVWFLDVWKRTCALRKKSSVEFIHLSLIQCMKIVSKLQGDTRLKMMAAKLFWDRMFTARCHIHFPRVHIAIKSA